MFTTIFGIRNKPQEPKYREGDLYKLVTTFDKTFVLRYGYYDEGDRQSPLCEPAVIYPDFLKTPVYTEGGEPFVTMMQDSCECYKGELKRTPDTACADCKHFRRGEEWFGICTCPRRKKTDKNTDNKE